MPLRIAIVTYPGGQVGLVVSEEATRQSFARAYRHTELEVKDLLSFGSDEAEVFAVLCRHEVFRDKFEQILAKVAEEYLRHSAEPQKA